MSHTAGLPDGMTAYERAAWRHLEDHWQKKAKRREILPAKARSALESVGPRSRDVVTQTGQKIADHTPQRIKDAGGHVVDQALVPTLKAAAHLLELAEDWAAEAMNSETVVKYHQGNGHGVAKLADLRTLALEPLDVFTRRLALRWRSLGATEGAAMGVLSFVPVAGTGVALTVDIVVMQMLSVAIASRAMYSYGYDAQHPDERQMVEKIVRRSYRAHAPKAKVVRDASKAYRASKNRINWSQKIRDDHKLMAAVERLMKQVSDGRVSIQDVSTKMPYIGVVTSAGMNAHVLGDVAKQGVLYGRTRLLSEKYGLPLPVNLQHLGRDDDFDTEADGL